ncbi:uncharacterized protein LOC103317161 [Nasonia vitripennis]|uniref:Uncharacterized protein n=1 Tax=Nasonia vitripennis TaxID=7425 RepID=A0A7M7T9L6_NASVI|nr:uncharacterized protein LOC103317161 [Nasonia vitripennis]
MLKMYLSREVAAQYVAVKQRKHKYVMKPTNFFSLAEALIIERRSISHIKTCDKDMITALSNVLSNAGSWYTSKKSEPSIQKACSSKYIHFTRARNNRDSSCPNRSRICRNK